jgi:acyl-CoA synthetase (AMP-forming)/AMP-acid ligase II
VGFVDADGYVYVVDRIKDVVIRGGENVYCAEVEAVLFEHPDVADVAVVGLAEPTLGERVCAVVVPRSGRTPDLNGVRSFATGQLAAFKCPEALVLADALPRTATEKVAKNVLRDRLAEPGTSIERLW